MKTRAPHLSLQPGLLILAAFFAALPLAAAEPPVRRSTGAEIFLAAPFMSGGAPAWVVVDRTSGNFRVGRLNAADQIVWSEARASGIAPVDDVTPWKRAASLETSLVFAGRVANQARVLDPVPAVSPEQFWFDPHFQRQSFGLLLDAYGPYALGTQVLAATSPNASLVVVSGENRSATISQPNRANWIRHNSGGGAPTVAQAAQPLGGLTVGAQVAPLSAAEPSVLWVHRQIAAGIRIDLYGGDASLLGTVMVSHGDTWVRAPSFAGGGPRLYSFSENDSALHTGTVSPALDIIGLTGTATYDLGFPIAEVLVLPVTGAHHLVVGNAATGAAHHFRLSSDGLDTLGTYHAASPGHHLFGLLPDEAGGFLAHTGPSRHQRARGFERFSADGSGGFARTQSGSFAVPASTQATSNILLFEREPFVDTNPGLVQRMSSRAWTHPTPVASPSVDVLAETFRGESEGLGDGQFVEVGDVSPAAAFMLANQIDTDMSIAPVGNLGVGQPEIYILPVAGLYDTSIFVELATNRDDALILYRLGESEPWQTYSDPFWVYRETAVEAFAVVDFAPLGLTGRIASPIRRHHYRFTLPPEALDSDFDGVPDFVEIAYGLDPVNSGPDGDGDGVSDLEEILQGSNPTDSSSFPDPALRSPLDLRASFDVAALVAVYDSDPALTPPAPGAMLRAHAFERRLLGQGRQPAATDPRHPRMVIQNVPLEDTLPLVFLRTEFHFRLPADEELKSTGREALALVLPPAREPLAINFTYGGGTLADEAAAWVAAAQAAFAGHARLRVEPDVDPLSTLHAALFEARLEQLLAERGLLETDDALTLFPTRPRDATRVPLRPEHWELLQSGNRWRIERPHTYPLAGPFDDLFLPSLLSQTAARLQDDLSPEMSALRQLAVDIFQISAASHGEDFETIELPYDVFRMWIRGDGVPEGFSARLSLDGAALALAASARDDLLGTDAVRALVSSEGYLTATSRATTGCLVLAPANGGGAFALVDAKGAPFRVPSAFPILAGSRFLITGYATEAPVCAPTAIEVLEITLIEVPPVSSGDSLLPLAWEFLFFGDAGADPFSSPDGSGYTLLQQYFEGTDPTDSASLPVVLAEDLGPPFVRIVRDEGAGFLHFDWSWSPRYAHRIRFVLESGESLDDFALFPFEGSHAGGGNFSLSIPMPSNDRVFYRLRQELRP